MKKNRFIRLGILFFLLLGNVPFAFVEEVFSEESVLQPTSEKQVVLDEDYAKVEAQYKETEKTFEWTVEFTKKKSDNEGRIRLAIDEAAAGIGTVKNVRGDGLASYNEEGTELKTEEIDGQQWYVGVIYSQEKETGVLQFETEKMADTNEGELPLQVIVDEKVKEENQPGNGDDAETTDNVTSETGETADKVKQKEAVKEEQAQSEESVSKEMTATGEKEALTSDEKTQNETDECASQEGSGVRLPRIQSPLFNGVLERLGPTTTSDPYKYIQSGDGDVSQSRYPNRATNDYTAVSKDGSQSNQKYQGDKGSLYPNNQDEGKVDDAYDQGGANWRNYNYAVDNGSEATEESKGERAKTVQLWGDERTFENSYLDYNGAYIKKWVEPITKSTNPTDVHPEDGTTLYNVYLDVIGGESKEVHPVDLVFVLDKSGSMGNATGVNVNETKNTALVESVKEISKNLLENPLMDVRIGLVNFYRGPYNGNNNKAGITSGELAMTNDITQINSSAVLSQAPSGGTPLTLGLRKGYELLYRDNGGGTRKPEKILIVVGDGNPTFSYGPVQRGSGNNWNDVTSMKATDTEGLFKNFEPFGGNTSGAGFATNTVYPSDFARPNGNNYRRGEVKENDSKTTHWTGNGSSDNDAAGNANSAEKTHAVNTVAYHHWLKNKYQEEKNDTPNIFTIGLGISGSVDGRQRLDAIGRNVLKNMADLKDNGETPYYYDANNKSDIVKALEDISSTFTKTIRTATLYDETGFNVSLLNGGANAAINFYKLAPGTNGMKYQAPQAWTENTPPDVVAMPTNYEGRNNHAYQFSPISLGEGEMVRIKYQVKLDGGAQDGVFYTVNNMAYIQNRDDYEKEKDSGKMFFPAPSIRYMHNDRNLQIKKIGQNGKPLKGVQFALYDKNPDLEENKDEKPLENSITTDDGMAIFETKFSVTGDGHDAVSKVFWVKEVSGPDRYQLNEETLQFQVKKYLSNETEKLGHYELVDINTSGTREGGPEGQDPDAVNTGKYHKLKVVQEENEDGTDYDRLYVSLEMRNEYKPIYVNLKKLIKGSKRALDGASFDVFETDGLGNQIGKPIARGVSGESEAEENGLLTFYALDTEGNYELVEGKKVRYAFGIPDKLIREDKEAQVKYAEYKIVETENPEGFEDPGEENQWLLRIRDDERIRLKKGTEANWQNLSLDVTESEQNGTMTKELSLTIEAENTFAYREISVRKLTDSGVLLDGAGFRITKEGDTDFPTYQAYTGNPLDVNHLNEKGIGYFYTMNSGVEVYKNLNYDQPLQLSPGTYSVKENRVPNGYMLSNQTFTFTVTEDGKFEVGGKVMDGLAEEDAPKGYQMVEGKLQLTLENKQAPVQLELLKRSNNEQYPLEGAEFSLEKELTDGQFEKIEDGLKVDGADGARFTTENLAVGKYRITETKAPEGHRLLPGHFILNISYREIAEIGSDGAVLPGKEAGTLKAVITYVPEAGSGQEETSKELAYQLIDNERIQLTLNVSNDPTNPLPATGGNGRRAYFGVAAIIVGLASLAGAGLRYWQKKGGHLR